MKPILFNTEMVRALLSGQKTQTRRIVKPQPQSYSFDGRVYIFDEGELPKPQYKPGDILWVREKTYCTYYQAWDENTYYAADYDGKPDWVARVVPSIHMPREAARLFLRVTDVRVERLRDIDENGAIAEGLYKGWRLCGMGSLALSARQAFMWLWETITRKAPAADSWACNPWVWVISFERIGKENVT